MHKLIQLIKKYHYFVVAGLLGLMFGLGIASMAQDSAIADEVAHIPAAYGYVHYGDYRLNPEHPPLIKDLAALPLQFMSLSFPVTSQAWTTDVNNQWSVGRQFMYYDGNNASRMLFFARLPILILAIGFGALLYEVVRRKFGLAVGLLTAFFYSLDPNILAHARYVTTDLGAAVSIFIAVVCFVKFLEKPNYKTGTLATIFLAVAELSKFSAILLVPLYVLLVGIAVVAWDTPHSWISRLRLYGLGLAKVGLAGLVLVWLYYIPNTIHMSAAVQQHLVAGVGLRDWKLAVITKLASYNNIPGVKALTQYVLGVLMVLGRVAGNTTYFLGRVSNQSFLWYFPVTYLLKTPIAMLVLTAAAVVTALARCLVQPLRSWRLGAKLFCREHFLRLAALAFIGLYILFSMTGNLDLGIRHLMPIFPFIFMLVAYETVSLGRKLTAGHRVWAAVLLAALMGYFAYANFSIYPSYVAYFNEFIGSPSNASKYLSDSSVDWGQDLRRLQDYVGQHHIQHIAVDYFGGGEPQYQFCSQMYGPDLALVNNSAGFDCSSSPYIQWDNSKGIYSGQYMAVSETDLMSDIYINQHAKGNVGYARLRAMKPIAEIGYSIYIYKLY